MPESLEMPVFSPYLQRFISFMHWHYRLLLRLLAAAGLLLLAVILAWQFYVLPRLDEYRPWLVQKLENATASQISMGRLSGGWHGIHPFVRIDEFKVHKGNLPGLQLTSVDADLSWWSLLRGELLFSRLATVAPQLTLRRDQADTWFVAGFQVQAGAAKDDNRFINWLLAQGELTITGGQLSWLDEKTSASKQVFTALDLDIKQRFGRHQFEVSVKPPVALADTLALSGNWRGNDVGEWRDWSGQLKLDFPRVDLKQLFEQLPAPWLSRLTGEGGVRATLHFAQARIEKIDTQLKLNQLAVAWPDAPQALYLPIFEGGFIWQDDQREQSLRLKAAHIATSSGDLCQTCSVNYRRDKAGMQYLDGQSVRLNGLAALSAWLPADFQDASLKGKVDQFSARWQGPWQSAKLFSAEIDAKHLELALPQLGLPQLGRFDLSAKFDQAGGKGSLTSNDLSLTIPAQFLEPLHFDKAGFAASWQRAGKGWKLDVAKAAFANGDTDIRANAQYLWPGSGLGYLDLKGDIRELPAKRAYLYLPRAAGDETLAWLKTSLLSGKAVNGRAQLRGNLQDFPFRNPKDGVFRITADAKDVGLSYADDWPSIEHIDAALDFHGAAMDIHAKKGKIFGAELRDVAVSIADMDSDSPLLKVKGKAQGPTSEFLQFVHQSPVKESTSGFTDDLKASGNGELVLELSLPLENTDASKITGEYHFVDNQLDFGGAVPLLAKAAGRIAFTEHTLTIKDAKAQALGGALKLSGASNAQGNLLLNMNGQAEIQDVADRYGLPFKQRLHGKVPYQASLSAGQSQFALSVQSPLQGLAVDLPAPMAKTSGESRPMRLRIKGGTQEATQLEWAYDKSLQLQLLLGNPPAQAALGNQPPIEAVSKLKGQLVLGAGALPAMPKAGISVSGNLPELNVQAWLDLADEIKAEPAGARPSPFAVDLRINRLMGWGRQLNEFKLKAQEQNDASWKGSVDSKELAGAFDWSAKDKGKLSSRLSKLWLPFPVYGTVSLATPLQQLPALDLAVNDFRYKNFILGKLDVNAVQQGENWRLNGVSISNPDGKLNMSGVWAKSLSRTSGNFSIETENFGKLLTRLGVPDTMRRAPAKLSGDVAWDGELFPPDLSTLQGKLRVDVEAGQFAKIDPGVGRLLSILSLQSLARRVQLDFRDVFSEGFEFDSIRGDSVIDRGVAHTDNLVIAGPAAQVLFRGDANFMAATQNLRVRIVPVIGDSVAVATTIINPVIGVATFLLQRVFKDPLGQLVAYEYDITGSMLDPQIKGVSSPLSRLPFARNK
ncbi:YhdP family protein [Iodobacter sp. CM08]|uniref:YhdP family protein n=1 Tax=Iodobacter sp. CM08 TaxID=3085902 RepID=UPI0029814938|nr:YhdP family protein [Iodobacter sp. CM08]MDW5417493.1 YhdP family protein [Iodobacter sp. CM08]